MRLGAPFALLALAGAFGLGWYAARPHAAAPSDSAAFAEVLRDPDALRGIHHYSVLLQSLGPDNLPAALAAVDEGRRITPLETRLFFHAWVRFDPHAALEYALTWRDPQPPASMVVLAWATGNPAAARQGLEAVEDPVLRGQLQDELVSGWARSGDTRGVTDHVAALPVEKRRREFLLKLLAAEQRRAGGLDAVMAWVAALPDDVDAEFRRMAFAKAALILADTDPRAAVRWLEPHLGEAYAAEAPGAIAANWIRKDAPAALGWVETLPEGAVRDEALTAALRRWLSAEPSAARAWIAANEPPEDVRRALASEMSRRGARRPAPPDGADSPPVQTPAGGIVENAP
jgi:hypothetical protein